MAIWSLTIFQAEDILHIKKPGGLIRQPDSGSYCAIGERHTTGGFVGNFQALAFIGKHHGMLTHDITGTNCGKTNGFAVARSSFAFTTINGAIF
jgi:hypothetical protein